MTTEEFKAYCAELAAKLQDGRALAEARERILMRKERIFRFGMTPEEQLDDDAQWDAQSPEALRWHK